MSERDREGKAGKARAKPAGSAQCAVSYTSCIWSGFESYQLSICTMLLSWSRIIAVGQNSPDIQYVRDRSKSYESTQKEEYSCQLWPIGSEKDSSFIPFLIVYLSLNIAMLTNYVVLKQANVRCSTTFIHEINPWTFPVWPVGRISNDVLYLYAGGCLLLSKITTVKKQNDVVFGLDVFRLFEPRARDFDAECTSIAVPISWCTSSVPFAASNSTKAASSKCEFLVFVSLIQFFSTARLTESSVVAEMYEK